MSVEVVLVDEEGHVIERLIDVHDFVDRAIGAAGTASDALKWIDPYGDTTFNTVQAEALLDDWRRAEPLIASSQDRVTWDRLAALAVRCQSEPHLYLRFIGD